MKFPVVKVPQELIKIKCKHIESPFVIPKPEQPIGKTSSYKGLWLIVFSLIIIMFGSLNNSDGTIEFGLFLLLISIVWRSIESVINKKNREEYNKALSTYNKDMLSYNEQMKEFFKIQNIRDDLFLSNLYLLERREAFFDEVVKPNCHVQIKKGISENYFLPFLQKYFHGEIFCDQGVLFDDISVNPYVPDFIFLHSNHNFIVDIEIDEPYSFDSREPIHYRIDDSQTSDTRRDLFFSFLQMDCCEIFRGTNYYQSDWMLFLSCDNYFSVF